MFKTYKLNIPKGYLGDQGAQWFTQDDWDRHNEYVDELVASGEYGRLEEHSVTLMVDDRFDNPHKGKISTKFYSYEVIDLSRR